MTGMPHKSVRLKLQIFPDVNIIFGQKGTGKTEILKSLYDEMVRSGKNCRKYIASENTDDFKAFTSIGDMEADLDKVGANPCYDEFSFISEWTDTNPIHISNYIQWAETKGNSNNKSRMKITEAVHDNFIKGSKYDIHKVDKVKIDDSVRLIDGINIEEYLDDNDRLTLLKLLVKLRKNINSKREEDVISEYASRLTNFSIDKIKGVADLVSDTVSHRGI